MLEKTVEKLRDDLRRQKDEYKMEKTQRIKTQNTIKDLYVPINQVHSSDKLFVVS